MVCHDASFRSCAGAYLDSSSGTSTRWVALTGVEPEAEGTGSPKESLLSDDFTKHSNVGDRYHPCHRES